MKPLPIITVAREGGPFTKGHDLTAPIRIYRDRWIEDDIAAAFTGNVRRERLSRKEFRHVRRASNGRGV